jgi:DNA-binding NarL/FixJ family response regulator
MKVLVVDDDPQVLAAIHAAARRVGDEVIVVDVPGVADVAAALDSEPGFDLCLLHVEPDAPGGFEDLMHLRCEHPLLPVVALSPTDQASQVVSLIERGAMGCVPRRLDGDHMATALAMVLAGGVFIPSVALGLLEGVPAEPGDAVTSAMRPVSAAPGPGIGVSEDLPLPPRVGPVAPSGPVSLAGLSAPAHASEGSPSTAAGPVRPPWGGLGLTPRQCDVLALLLKGLPNKLIAREMNLAVDTVKDHVAAVLRALNVNSRTQAVLVVSQMSVPAGGWQVAGPR